MSDWFERKSGLSPAEFRNLYLCEMPPLPKVGDGAMWKGRYVVIRAFEPEGERNRAIVQEAETGRERNVDISHLLPLTPPPMEREMSEIKPLQWREARVSDKWERYSAESVFGDYEALEWSNGGYGGTLAPVDADSRGVEFDAATIEEARHKCEMDYASRVSALISKASKD